MNLRFVAFVSTSSGLCCLRIRIREEELSRTQYLHTWTLCHVEDVRLVSAYNSSRAAYVHNEMLSKSSDERFEGQEGRLLEDLWPFSQRSLPAIIDDLPRKCFSRWL